MRLVLRGRIPHARDAKSVAAPVAVWRASPLHEMGPALPDMAPAIGSRDETWQDSLRIRAPGELTMRQPPRLFS